MSDDRAIRCAPKEPDAGQERVLVCVAEGVTARQVIRVAAQLATELEAEFYALYVEAPGAATRRSPEDSEQLARNLGFARDVGAQVEIVSSHRVAESILRFARAHQISRIVLGRSRNARRWRLFGGGTAERVASARGEIAVELVSLVPAVEE